MSSQRMKLLDGGVGFPEWTRELVERSAEYEFNCGYSHIDYHGTGIYQALKNACGWDWKDIIKSNDISWLQKPQNYNGSLKSFFTMKGYREFKEKVMPIVRKYLDEAKIREEYIESIDERSVVYSDEFQVIVRRDFNALFEDVMNSIKRRTIL